MTTSPELPAPIDRFIDAVNRHDTAAFLDMFTSEGRVDDWGRVFATRDEIATWNDREFIGSDGILTPQSVTVGDDATVTVVGDWRSTHANGLSAFTFEVDGDQIRSMTIREG
ncbi:nuclear transport factor 2 family protein [Gordonia soli]|uniref:SnoaL-like domain-containing protein n=1 Tax=Gordonia soli NBRC 108243 TaxID=1223545 RepID=M0QNC1_9ACTN|nr:nuclear transport factor 2 family protein [Gordonia soli]GAC70165.1 hypothetical protein GS4_32_01090 [Gordonia soli NBRC 108243]